MELFLKWLSHANVCWCGKSLGQRTSIVADGFQFGKFAHNEFDLTERACVAHVDEDLGGVNVEYSPLTAVKHGLSVGTIQRGHVPLLVHDQHGLDAIPAHLLDQDGLDLVAKEELDRARVLPTSLVVVLARSNLFSVDELEEEVSDAVFVNFLLFLGYPRI